MTTEEKIKQLISELKEEKRNTLYMERECAFQYVINRLQQILAEDPEKRGETQGNGKDNGVL